MAFALKNYLSLIKFSHTIFALPFAIIGFVLAIKDDLSAFNPLLLVYVILCMVFARSAAMGFNRYIDRKFDAQNPRTKMREVPAGVISASAALWFVIIMSVLFITTTWFINPICFYLSPVALLVVLGYSYTKRFTALCHLVLGVGLGLAPIGSYLAVTGEFAWLPLLYSFAVFFWVSGFDIIFALQDEEFDRSLNLKSIPSYLGKVKALRLSELLHIISATFVIGAGYMAGFGPIYWVGVAFFCGLLTYQHLIVKPNDLSRVNLAFGTVNGIASVVFACFTLAEILIN
ncbi:MAG: UbiA-like polyprenyltransferase [Bacteroidota bacterium]|nr:UbiA-like polyprenyltransferase [Bacteroidota bacterium]